MHELSRTLLYGFLAAASPVTLLAALASLATGRGRVTGVAFAAAFVLGQTVAYLVAFLIGSAYTERGHSTAVSYLELAAGAVLLLVALRARTTQALPSSVRAPRTETLFRRLEHTKPAIAFGVGLPLGIGAKRLTITILAATTLGVAGLGPAANTTLGVLYVVVATTLVWIPVVLYLVFGAYADVAVSRTRDWVVTHELAITYASALALGILLVLDGVIRLVA